MVLVGHSYGGAVISNAVTGNQQVQALVFIAGWSRMFVALLLASTAALVGCAWAGEYERTMPSRYAGTWQDRTGRELRDDHPSSEGFALLSYDGARHCDTQSVTFLAVARPPGKVASSIDARTVRQYVRDPHRALRQVNFLGEFADDVPLPPDARPPATTTAPTPCGSARPTPTATSTSKAPTAWNAGLARPSRSTAPDRSGRAVQKPPEAWLAWSTTQSTFCVALPARTLTANLPELRCLTRATLGSGRPQATDLVLGAAQLACGTLR